LFKGLTAGMVWGKFFGENHLLLIWVCRYECEIRYSLKHSNFRCISCLNVGLGLLVEVKESNLLIVGIAC
jgi:hypothetical protein